MQVAISVPQLEREMLQMPQAECQVWHRFGPGIYIREVTLRAGTIAIGHAQRFEHTNLMLTGAVAMLDPDTAAVRVLRAPLFFVGKPGRKIGYVLEETVWQNIYATEERDIDRLEEMFLDKSTGWAEHDAQARALEAVLLADAREDFLRVVTAAGFTPETVRAQSEATHDLIPMPPVYEGAVGGSGIGHRRARRVCLGTDRRGRRHRPGPLVRHANAHRPLHEPSPEPERAVPRGPLGQRLGSGAAPDPGVSRW
jgi:hypothetical protein